MQQNPEKISYATPGVGSPHNLAMEMFKDDNKISATPIHYRGGALMVQDLMGRHVDLMVLDVVSSAPLIKSGKVRPLVVFSKNRLTSLPDVPTTFELKLGTRESFAWQGVAIPQNTPDTIKTRISDALLASINSPSVQKKLIEYGAEPTPSTAQEMKRLWEIDDTFWVPFIKSKGITADQ